VKLETRLSDGDRVEIYRPITADPETVERRDQVGGDDAD
jgi:putative ubiquitin-RnfH superfamily antitoxin RatB of RatAB toxin-antitoxin module